jgi:hypothetical protein
MKLLAPMLLSLGMLIVWFLPDFWYVDNTTRPDFKWFGENTNAAGYSYSVLALDKTAEAILVADRLQAGEFRDAEGTAVNVYSAKRYSKKENEIGLFSHTPDRCWTIAGWEIEPTNPDCVELTVHEVPILFERRIYRHGTHHELVYFGALIGGKPLPYRIDQYYAAGRSSQGQGDAQSTLKRLRQGRLWGWAWESFIKRTPLAGPQQFIRISTAVDPAKPDSADAQLRRLLPLRPCSWSD